ncbi:hypothetical protein D0A39_18570 [Xanthomonas campestris pv. campestris]|nr:hypothetical protein D0A39_18570 [Xanthomonas campestris pv. campestris]
MNWMRAPEALDIAANIHFPYLTAFVFRMDCVRADKQGLTKGGRMPGIQRTVSSYNLKAPKRVNAWGACAFPTYGLAMGVVRSCRHLSSMYAVMACFRRPSSHSKGITRHQGSHITPC